MTDFSNLSFTQFEKKFNCWLGARNVSYPIDYLFNCLFRLHYTGRSDLADRNIRKLNRHAEYWHIWNLLFRLAIFYLSHFNRISVFIRSNGASKLFSDRLKDHAKLKGVAVYGTLYFDGSIGASLNYIFSGTYIFDLFERSLCTSRVIKEFKCLTIEQALGLSSDTKFSTALKSALENDIMKAVSIIKKLRITGALVHTDHTTSTGIFCIAAKQLGVPVAVLAHGDFRSPLMISVLPLRADKIFMFTDRSFELICSELSEEKVGLVKTMKSAVFKRRPSKRKVIVAASPWYIYNTPVKKERLKCGLLELRENWPDYELIFCPHPLENSNELMSLVKDLGFKYNAGKTSALVVNASVVVGGHSSILFECSKNSIPTFQLKELCIEPEKRLIDGVRQISSKDLSPKLLDEFTSPIVSSVSNHDENALNKDVDTLLEFLVSGSQNASR